jgi:enoyl-CoA hydratase
MGRRRLNGHYRGFEGEPTERRTWMATERGSVGARVDEREGGAVATVTVDNAAKLNVLDSAMMRAFVGEVEALGTRDDLRALVLRGAGERAFIGGANISEMATLDPARAE